MEITLHLFFTPVIDGSTCRGSCPSHYTLDKHSPVPTKAVREVPSHFEHLENRSRGLDLNWQPVREFLAVDP